jgi:hypothetical protein
LLLAMKGRKGEGEEQLTIKNWDEWNSD